MDPRMTEGEQNLLLLQKLIPREEKLYVWCYNFSGDMSASSCPEEEEMIFDQAFRLLGGLTQALSFAESPENEKPVIIGSPIGMQWAVTFEPNRNHGLIFVTGPVFYTSPLEKQIRSSFRSLPFSRENRILENELCRLLPDLPVIPYAVFIRYVLMVHNTLTGQQLGLDALVAEGAGEHRVPDRSAGQHDRTKVYLAEKALQTSLVVFITIVTRAAMEGGLSPEIAYPLGDSYIQSVEDCNDSGELSALAHAMYHDFIYRVHYLHANPNYSHAIQKCCDYIELSLDRKIKISDLAALVGYSEYYLTEKFRKETGQSLNSYIRTVKVERAKLLLRSTDLTIREISERLAFSTVNFFIKSFRDTTGETPAQYRKEDRHKG